MAFNFHSSTNTYFIILTTKMFNFSQIAMMSSLAGFGYDIGIEAEDGGDHEGKLPSLVYIAWENGDDVKKLANFFTLTRGAVAISEAQCITHKVYLNSYSALKSSKKCNFGKSHFLPQRSKSFFFRTEWPGRGL